jgi:hypothetical protein
MFKTIGLVVNGKLPSRAADGFINTEGLTKDYKSKRAYR